MPQKSMFNLMPQTRAGFIAILALMWPALASAQAPSLDHASVVKLCTLSTVETHDASRAKDRGHAVAKSHLLRVEAPVSLEMNYQQVLGLAEFRLPDVIPSAPGTFVSVQGDRTLKIEMTEARALDLLSAYLTRQVQVELELLLIAHDNYDEPLCTTHGAAATLRTVLVKARFVDGSGAEHARYVTDLGGHLRLLRSLNVDSYLGDGTPEVTVSALAYVGDSQVLKTASPVEAQAQIDRDELGKQLQTQTFGCYVRGLSKNARLQGAIVLKMKPGDPDGSLILMSSLNDEDMKRCVLTKLRNLANALAPAGEGLWRATMIFQLRPRQKM